MKFSIVIPLYNKQSSIRKAIYSALDQDEIDAQNIQLIVVDDGSTDHSANLVKQIQTELPAKNIKLIRQANAGVSAARNRGVEEADFDTITFLDSDDTYRPNFLSEIRQLINQYPDASLFATSYAFVDIATGSCSPARTLTKPSTNKNRLIENLFLEIARTDLPFCASSFAVKRSVFAELGGFPERENMGEDQDFYIRAALHGNIAHSYRVCANYFIGVEASLMQSTAPIEEMPYSVRLQKRLVVGELPRRFQNGAEQLIAGHLMDLVRRNLASQNVAIAKTLLRDKRSKKRPIKWFYWYLKSIAA